MKKILFISTLEHGWGGSEILWSRSASSLSDSQYFRVEILAPKSRIDVSNFDRFKQSGSRVRFFPGKSRFFRPKLRVAIARGILRLTKPHLVVISQAGSFDGSFWARICLDEKVRYFLIVQAAQEQWWPPDESQLVLRVLYESAERIVFVSRHNQELIQRQLNLRLPNSILIPNPPASIPGAIPLKWPDPYPIQIAVVARLEPWAKGQDSLLKALSQRKWKSRNIGVNFYGTGKGALGLKQLARSLEVKAQFFGHVTDLEAIWERNHVLVLPSLYEGLPLAAVEAMLFSRPVLMTPVGGYQELIIDGETGWLASGTNPHSLDLALERMYQDRDLMMEMGLQAEKRATRLISPNPIDLLTAEVKKVLAGLD